MSRRSTWGANGLALVLLHPLHRAHDDLARTILVPLSRVAAVMVAAAGLMVVVGVLFLLLAEDRTVPSRHAALKQIFALVRDTQLLRGAFMYFLLFGGYLALLGLLPRALARPASSRPTWARRAGCSPGRVATTSGRGCPTGFGRGVPS